MPVTRARTRSAGAGRAITSGAVAPGQHFGEEHPGVRAVLLLADERHGRAQLTEPAGETDARESGADHHHTRIRGHV
ncbi:hypothetical protein SALBM311S_08537 [Streptomyces alboniger]